MALVLSGGALILVAGEAWAQQRSPAFAPELYAAVTGAEETAVAGIGGDETAVRLPAADLLPSRAGERDDDAPPVSWPEPVTPGDPELVPAPLESFVPAFEPGLAAGTEPASGPAVTLLDPGPVWEAAEEPEPAPGPQAPAPLNDLPPASDPAGTGFAPPDPRLLPEPAPDGGAAPEKHRTLPSRAGEGSPALSPVRPPDAARPGPLPERAPAGAVPAGPPSPVAGQGVIPATVPAVPKQPLPGAAVPGSPREAPSFLSGLEAAANSAVETLQSAARSVAASAAVGVSGAMMSPGGEVLPGGSTPAGAEGASEDTPPPPAPPAPAPLGGNSFSLSGMGQAGPGGGVAPLFICILVAGVILLRPGGGLSWASCELPKPSSALLIPLERPG